MGQHVDSQDLDVTKASHCTGSTSPVLASGDAGEVCPDENKRSPQQHQQESPAGEKSGHTAGEKSIANCRQGPTSCGRGP